MFVMREITNFLITLEIRTNVVVKIDSNHTVHIFFKHCYLHLGPHIASTVVPHPSVQVIHHTRFPPWIYIFYCSLDSLQKASLTSLSLFLHGIYAAITDSLALHATHKLFNIFPAVTYVPSCGGVPTRYLITLCKVSYVSDLKAALCKMIGLNSAEHLVTAEVFDNHIARIVVGINSVLSVFWGDL